MRKLSYFKLSIVFLVFQSFIFSTACAPEKSNALSANARLDAFPPIILWAWERPENLRFSDPRKFGVAFLAQTLFLQNDEVIFSPRRQPLQVAPETFLIAVTRIETNRKDSRDQPALSDAQKSQTINFIKQTLKLPNVKAVQIDFDALVSERDFYKNMIRELRAEIPENVSITMTALASWCAADDWLADFPVDEAVPMAFRMGADDKQIREFMASEKDWSQPLCQGSYGIALDEPLKTTFKIHRRFYIFHNRPWRAEDLKHLPEGVLQ